MVRDKILTIVIPAYNMHDYLHRCLDSLCVESVMDDVQVIVVNDGSTDDTLQIAHEYEQRFPHYFQVIDKANGNYGSCMNVALPLAVGKYFRTLDADDWFDQPSFVNFLEQLAMTEADLLLCERNDVQNTSESDIIHLGFDQNVPLHQDLQVSESLWYNPSVRRLTNVMSMVFKTECLRSSKMQWSEGVFYSDIEYTTLPLRHVHSVRFIGHPVYQYLCGREDQSVSKINRRRNFDSYYTVLKRVLDDFLLGVPDVMHPLYNNILTIPLANIYSSLVYDGMKNKKQIDQIEERVKTDIELYQITSEYCEFRCWKHVAAYRNNILLCHIIHLDFVLRSFCHRIIH